MFYQFESDGSDSDEEALLSDLKGTLYEKENAVTAEKEYVN